jgi:hypothetical protein
MATTTFSPASTGRRCHNFLNALHSTIYFSRELSDELEPFGIQDPMVVYFVGRAAAMGRVGPGVLTAALHGFKYDLLAQLFPATWDLIDPQAALAARLRAADRTLRGVLRPETISSADLADAAELALRACRGCSRSAHPLYSAHADQPIPTEPHLALWHAATLLREHRGDNHFVVLTNYGLDGIEGLVSHSASDEGFPKEMVMAKRGWTEADWAAAEGRLRRRGLMDGNGDLTRKGVALRRMLETETDRLDHLPYQHLGSAGLERLTRLAAEFTAESATGGAFPEPIAEFFTRG